MDGLPERSDDDSDHLRNKNGGTRRSRAWKVNEHNRAFNFARGNREKSLGVGWSSKR